MTGFRVTCTGKGCVFHVLMFDRERLKSLVSGLLQIGYVVKVEEVKA